MSQKKLAWWSLKPIYYQGTLIFDLGSGDDNIIMEKKRDESGRERGKVSILGVVALWGDCRNIPTGI